MPLSCGQTEPSWYENGLYAGWSDDSVRIAPAAPHVVLHQAIDDPGRVLGRGDAAP